MGPPGPRTPRMSRPGSWLAPQAFPFPWETQGACVLAQGGQGVRVCVGGGDQVSHPLWQRNRIPMRHQQCLQQLLAHPSPTATTPSFNEKH